MKAGSKLCGFSGRARRGRQVRLPLRHLGMGAVRRSPSKALCVNARRGNLIICGRGRGCCRGCSGSGDTLAGSYVGYVIGASGKTLFVDSSTNVMEFSGQARRVAA